MSAGPISGKSLGGGGACRAGGLGCRGGEEKGRSSNPSQERLAMLGVVLVLS